MRDICLNISGSPAHLGVDYVWTAELRCRPTAGPEPNRTKFAVALGVPGLGAGVAHTQPIHAPHRAPSNSLLRHADRMTAMKPLLTLGTIMLAIGAATTPARAGLCVHLSFGELIAECPPATPPVEQPKLRRIHLAKRQHHSDPDENHSDPDEKAPPLKPPPALPPRVDSETVANAPVGEGGSAQASTKIRRQDGLTGLRGRFQQ